MLQVATALLLQTAVVLGARVYGQPERQLTHFGPKVGLTTLLALYANLYSASFSVQQSFQAL
jgi:hypothetical protein